VHTSGPAGLTTCAACHTPADTGSQCACAMLTSRCPESLSLNGEATTIDIEGGVLIPLWACADLSASPHTYIPAQPPHGSTWSASSAEPTPPTPWHCLHTTQKNKLLEYKNTGAGQHHSCGQETLSCRLGCHPGWWQSCCPYAGSTNSSAAIAEQMQAAGVSGLHVMSSPVLTRSSRRYLHSSQYT
jgi:hypothetical protein